MIVILDYGMGNSGSILNMLKRVGSPAIVTNKKEDILLADGIILPGVGTFDNGMKALQSLDLVDSLNEKIVEGSTPFLGICLGMQLLFESSCEGSMSGLGWVNGTVQKFNFSSCIDSNKLKIPHMGWNSVNVKDCQGIFKDLVVESRFYFVHSYYVNCANPKNILATADYGGVFTCAVHSGNIYGVQFHPEKSHLFGITMFKNFLQIVNDAKN
jgi:imidazole glycerol-phosphate synthase subunit HisH